METAKSRTSNLIVLLTPKKPAGSESSEAEGSMFLSIKDVHPLKALAYLSLLSTSTPNLN